MTTRDEAHPRGRLSAWLDGEVDVEERAAVEAHLRDCASCRALVEDLRLLAGEIAAEEPPPVPRDLAARIGWRLRSGEAARREEPRRNRWRPAVPLTGAASLVAASLLVVILWRDVPVRGPSVAPPAAESPALPIPEETAQAKALRPAEPAPAKDEITSRGEAERVPEAREATLVEAQEEVARTPREKEVRRDAAAGAATVAGRYNAPLRLVDFEAVPCSSPWAYAPEEPIVWYVMDLEQPARALEELALQVGGVAVPVEGNRARWRVEVGRERWPDLVLALRERGILDLGSATPPAGADCARLAIRLETMPLAEDPPEP